MTSTPRPRLLGRISILALTAAFLGSAAQAQSGLMQSRELLRAEFWTDLGGIPASGDPYPLPLDLAARRLVDEAAWVYSGTVYGFSFDWTPSDKARAIEESFSLVARGSIERGDPRFVPEAARSEAGRLYSYVSYSPDAAQRSMLSAYSRSPWRSSQGIGHGEYFKGYAGRRAAYEDSARQAIRELLRGLEPNKPRRVKGCIVFSGTPRIGLVEGVYAVQARFRIEVTEVLDYEVF